MGATEAGPIHIWEVATHRALATPAYSKVDPFASIILWDAETGQMLSTIQADGNPSRYSVLIRRDRVQCSPDGQLVVISCNDGRARMRAYLIDGDTLHLFAATGDNPFIGAFHITPDSSLVVLLADVFPASIAFLYTLPDRLLEDEIHLHLPSKPNISVLAWSMSPNNDLLALAYEDAQVWTWQCSLGAFVANFQAHPDFSAHRGGRGAQFWSLRSIAWSPDGTLLATGGYHPTKKGLQFSLRLWQWVW
jgi:WD40 repeat protein